MGNTALALLKHPSIPGGRLMAELVFRTHCPAPKRLHLNRFLPPTAVRVLLDESGANLTDKISFSGLSKNLNKVKKAVARDLIKSRHDQLRELLDRAETEAERELPSIVEAAQDRMRTALDSELARLEALAQRNPSVREDELTALRDERATLDAAIEGTGCASTPCASSSPWTRTPARRACLWRSGAAGRRRPMMPPGGPGSTRRPPSSILVRALSSTRSRRRPPCSTIPT